MIEFDYQKYQICDMVDKSHQNGKMYVSYYKNCALIIYDDEVKMITCLFAALTAITEE